MDRAVRRGWAAMFGVGMVGMLTVPVGCAAGGEVAGVSLPSGCELLTVEEVGVAVGTGPLAAEARGNPDKYGAEGCSYVENGVVVFEVRMQSFAEAGSARELVDTYTSSRPESAPLEGIGDAAAFYRGPGIAPEQGLRSGVIIAVDGQDGAVTDVVLELTDAHRPDAGEVLGELANRVGEQL